MGFADRTATAQRFSKVVAQELWSRPPFRDRFILAPFGQETHVVRAAMHRLRVVYTPTAMHIRYAPDFFLIDLDCLEKVYLLEYKCSLTPLHSTSRVVQVAAHLRKPHLSSADLGNWEESAYDNYVRLHSIGIRVAILYYCAYHERQLLCDFVETLDNEVFRFPVTATRHGSGTPAINFDVNRLRSLENFLVEEHNLSRTLVSRLCANLRERLAAELPKRA